jgi:uncharacterized membrane protein
MSSVRALVPVCFFAVSLLLTRWWWAGHHTFFFLVWNLFLALIPVAFAAITCRTRVGESLRFVAWILFFPNAPYLITDLLHLTPRSGVPLWFDVGLISTFAWAGLLAACLSLREMHLRVRDWRGEVAGWSFTAVVALLSGFGIWLGRFLRLNSWDALTEPLALAQAALQPLLHPVLHARAWGVALLFGGLLFVVYAGFSAERRPHTADDTPPSPRDSSIRRAVS